MTQAPTSEAIPAITQQQLAEQVRESVVEVDPWRRRPGGMGSSLIWIVGQYADGLIPWGSNLTGRDAQLRQFLTTESFVTSALATAVARNVALSWTLDGPEGAVEDAMLMLNGSERGQGFEDFVSAISWDLYTQDKGAFVELVGKDRPTDPCLGVQHLDALNCHLTGDPQTPVIYRDLYGRWHELKWFQTWHITEIPTPVERLSGVQICALSRIMAGAQFWRAVQTLISEKASGRFTKQVHIVNADAQGIKDSIDQAQAAATQQGQSRYMQPVIVESMDPAKGIELVTIPLASLPEEFDSEEHFKQIITLIAMGLLDDYQTFAPLPGGGLGTSMQSQVLHAKARGKGPGLFQRRFAQMMNTRGIIPRSVQFVWDDDDIQEDQDRANVRLTRAQARYQQVTTGEIDAQAARALAVDDGDITPEIENEMNAREAERQAAAERAQQQVISTARQTPGRQTEGPPEAAATTRGGSSSDMQQSVEGQKAGQPPEFRATIEMAAADAMEQVLQAMRRDVRDALAEEDREVKTIVRDEQDRVVEIVREKGNRRTRQIVERDADQRIARIVEVEEAAS